MGILSGKTAIVTGGTTGLGAATARLFHDEGAAVVVTGRNPETLARARDELAGIDVVASDAGDPRAAMALASYVGERHGGVDVLLANAGVGRFMPIGELDDDLFDLQFDVNVRGAIFMAKGVLPFMKNGSSIIFTGSASASVGVPGQAVYAACKGAVRSFARALAAEVGPRGIRVNTISPGNIPTPGYQKLGLSTQQHDHLQSLWVKAMTPLRRTGTAREFADAALFLAGPHSSFITGSEIFVDGGLVNA